MHILVVSHGIPSLYDPQWGCFELDQARSLASLGHKVTLAATDGRYRKYQQRFGITHSCFGTIDAYLYYLVPLKLFIWPFLKRMVRTIMMSKLFKTIQKEQGTPDVIYAHYMFPMSSLALVKKKYPEIPIIGIEHWSKLSESQLSSSLKKQGAIAYGQVVDKLLAVSPTLQKQIMFHFGKESTVVYDMVDDMFLTAPLNQGYDRNKPFVFASCGSLIPGKGFDILVKSFSKSEDGSSKLIIIGDGPERSSLQELVEDLGIVSRVCFTGRVSKEKIIEVYNNCSAFVLASRSETFGVSYVEAMAMGIPVISTHCGGPECFMDDECGIMVSVDDIDELTAAMNKMENEIGRFNREKIREYVYSHFSGGIIAKQLEKIFKETILMKMNECLNSKVVLN